MEYLGYVVSSEGVSMDIQKVQAMLDWPQPRNVNELKGFLGLTGYYRRFVKGYASIADPRTNLLKQNAYQWTELAQKAFEALKIAMSSTPVLTLPDFEKDFVFETYAITEAVKKWRQYLLRRRFII